MITDCLWIRRGAGLVPADPVTQEIIDGIKQGEHVTTDMPRNRRHPEFHKRAMLILSKVVEATQPDYLDVEDLMRDLKRRTRMYRIEKIGGHRVIEYQSVSFAAMSEQRFRRVLDRWLWIISTEIMPGVDPETLLAEAEAA